MKIRYRSLRSKIQNAMFRSTFISHIILACILIPSILGLCIPLGQLLTRGVAVEINQRYTMSDMIKTNKQQINSTTLEKLSEVELVAKIQEVNQTTFTEAQTTESLVAYSEELSSLSDVVVDLQTTDLKRLMALISDQYQKSNGFFEKQLPFIRLYTIDFQVNGLQFYLPDEKSRPKTNKETPFEKFVENSSTTLTVVDLNKTTIGSIKIGVNPAIVSMIIVPYIFLVLAVSFASLLVVSLLGKFMTAGILKPINSINKQLKAMAEGEFEFITENVLTVKKAPIEIHQLLNSANTILEKMHENQQLLEAQNEELHSQNDELFETKEIIQKQQNMLVQTEKMASIGQLSAAIVHEINTPVGAIKSNAQMIQMLTDQLGKTELSPEQMKPIEKINKLNAVVLQASDRVAGIIKSLKSYSRLDQSDFKASNLNEDLQNVILLTSNLWKNRISIEERYGDVPPVRCYSGLLNQVFMNLVVNAIDAMEDGGKLTLATYQDQDKAIIEISDTGSGILPENLDRIFEEGFTTKSKNKGSGLGLALSKDVVIKHKGRIEVLSEVGKGSLFRVIIPMDPELT